MKDNVKVLVLGDDGVGKSSLICTLISNHFSELDMPPVYEDVSIPAEATEGGVQVTIVDSSQSAPPEELAQKVAEADSIVLVYDVERAETLEHLSTYWLPYLVPRTNAPVIVAGNKVDTRGAAADGAGSDGPGSGATTLHQAEVTPLLEKYRTVVWACYECSAKIHHGIDEVFHMAMIVVTHPIAPIFELTTNELTPKCAQVMRRIFRCFDMDCDGVLSNGELRQFQLQCFQVPLADDDVAALRKVLAKETEGAVTRTGVTVKGFLGIFKLFISKHQPHTLQAPWMVMRLFGYDDELNLLPETLHELSANVPAFSPNTHVTQLSEQGERFLTRVFVQFSSRETGGGGGGGGGEWGRDPSSLPALRMDAACVAQVFDVVPPAEGARTPWASALWKDFWTGPFLVSGEGARAAEQTEGRETVEECWDCEVALSTWLASWHLAAALQPALTQRFLCFLGFNSKDRGIVAVPGPSKSLFPTPLRKRRSHHERAGVHLVVLGAAGCGKSTIVRRLSAPGMPLTVGEYQATLRCRTCATTVSLPTTDGKARASASGGDPSAVAGGTTDKFVMLTEVPQRLAGSMVEQRMASCDLAVLVFDPASPESLEFVLELEQRLPPGQPRLFVASKQDVPPLSPPTLKAKPRTSSPGAGGAESEEGPALTVAERARQHCADTELPQPIETSALHDELRWRDVTDELVEVAMDPEQALPMNHTRRRIEGRRWFWVKVVGLVAVSGAVAYAWFRPPAPLRDLWSRLSRQPRGPAAIAITGEATA